MNRHALDCLDFDGVTRLLGRFAATALGRGLIEHIRPTNRPDLVQRWLTQFDELRRVDLEHGLPPFGGVTDVRETVKRCAPPLRVTAEEIAQIGRTLRATHEISRFLTKAPDDCNELRRLAGRIGDFGSIADRVFRVIDDRSQVRDDASPKLAKLRREIEEARGAIGHAVERLLRDPEVRKFLQFPNHTFHNDRLVLPLRTEYRGRLPGIVHRSSDSGATLYVEPAAAVELNNRISNLRSEEDEEIARLLWDLAHEIFLNAEAILGTLDALAVLDVTSAKVRLAKDFGLRLPRLSDTPQLHVRQARHPLLIELFRRRREEGQNPGDVTPIDYRLGEDFRMLVVTGPNTGGKTVALKTIGLLSLMLQAGLPVPVEDGTTMCIFRDVLIDVGDEQSMQQSLSTFSAHLKRLLEMLRKAGANTLVLIDELGAGTDPDEGAAIGRAILDELLQLECRCVVTTHLGVLKSFALMRENVENACVEFDDQTLRPTYHLRIGEPGQSNAIHIAQRLGMPKRLVHAALQNLSKGARAVRDLLAQTSTVKRAAEQARQEAEDARRAADRARDEARTQRINFEQQQADFQAWVQRVVHLQPGDAVRIRGFDRDGRIVRMKLSAHRAEVNLGMFAVEVPLGDVLPPQTPAPPPKPPRPEPQPPPRPARTRHDGPRPASATPKRDSKPRDHKPIVIPSLTTEQATALQPGDSVYAKRFHRVGRVMRIRADKQIAIVNVGLFEVELPFDGLAAPESASRDRSRHDPSESSKRGPDRNDSASGSSVVT